MIIFGTRGITTKARPAEILYASCPECKHDLVLSKLKKWFTLYFIPIFPYETVETFYKCQSCKSTYREELKEILNDREEAAREIEARIEKHLLITTIYCAYALSRADGHIDPLENNLLQKIGCNQELLEKLELEPDIQQKSKELLREASDILTKEDLLEILAIGARAVMADGVIAKEEQTLLKDYLTVAGVPLGLYDTLIERAKESRSERGHQHKNELQFCTNCGTKVIQADTFCRNCGKSLIATNR